MKGYRYRMLHNLASNQAIYFMVKEVQQQTNDHRIHWVYDIMHHLGIASLKKEKHWDSILYVKAPTWRLQSLN